MKKLSFLKKATLLSMIFALSFFVFGCTFRPKPQPKPAQPPVTAPGRLDPSPEGEAQTVPIINTNVSMDKQTDIDKILNELDKMPPMDDGEEIDDSDIDQF